MTGMAERVEQARQRWIAGDLAGYLSLYDDSVRLHGYAPEPMDKAAVAAFYRAVHAAMCAPGKSSPDLTFQEVLTDRDLYTCRFTMSGVHVGPFLGVPATGRPYLLPGITIMRFRRDKVVERWSCADMLGLMVQLGAVAPPG